MGFIPCGLPRIRHTGESRYPENQTGFPRIKYGAGSVKHGMTVEEISDTSQLAAGQFIPPETGECLFRNHGDCRTV
jgi:hypothetical protein